MKKKSEKKRTEAQGKRIGEQNFKSQNQPGQKKNHEAKNSICHFICDGPLEALCHMTYPSWGAHTDTSIHLFRHLTHLERDGGMDSKIEGKGDKRMAGNKAFPCWPWSSAHCVDIHDNVPMGQTHYFTPFHPFMVSCTHMSMHTRAEWESLSVLG